MRLSKLARDDRGVSTLELGLVLPVLLLLLAVVVPLVEAGWEYMTLSRAAAAGIRYATRADTNARESSIGLTRRPTAAEVEAFVREAAEPLSLRSVSVSPEPAATLPGESITLTASHEVSFGPLADLANAVKSLFSDGQLLPQSSVVTVSARGREE